MANLDHGDLCALLACSPAYWDKSIKNATCGVNDRQWFMGTVTANFTLDLAVLILPMLYIKKLQVERSKKLMVAGMFTFGGFVVAISIILLVVCSKLNSASPDVSWTVSPIVVWAGTEINLSVVTSCLPSLRPIYLFLTQGSASPDRTASTKYKPRHHLVTFGSKGREHRKGGGDNEDQHPLSSIGDSSNVDLEEGVPPPPHDRVVVREDISVQYSHV
ncbi:MAG: hypothetical protein Q9195_005106 [Heterodermia aff. obscurata]